jgi:hypothetical protein
MPRIPNKFLRAHGLIPSAVGAPLGGLSCPYSRGAVAGQADDRNGDACANVRAATPIPGVGTTRRRPTTGITRMSESQQARQPMIAVIVAFVLAAILAQTGW